MKRVPLAATVCVFMRVHVHRAPWWLRYYAFYECGVLQWDLSIVVNVRQPPLAAIPY